MERHSWLATAALLSFTVALAMLLAGLYIRAERTFYFADYNAYLDFTSASLTAFRDSPWQGLRRLYQSLGEDYNFYFTLPLLPIMAALGESRTAYLLGITLFYHIGFALAIGGLAVHLIAGPARAVFWSAALLTLAVPTIWAPTLRGYPDLGAAALVAVAIAAYCRSMERESRAAAGAAGVCLAAAVLFRRPYAYAVTAFFAAMIVDAIVGYAAARRRGSAGAGGKLRRRAVLIGVAALSAGLTMVLFGWPFVWRTIQTDFSGLYAGFEHDVLYSVAFYASMYGVATCTLALIGFRLGLKTGVARHAVARFVGVFAAICFLQWVLVVRQTTVHYSTPFSIAVVLGLAALVWAIPAALQGRRRVAAQVALAAFLIANMIAGLAPVRWLEATAARWLFAAGHPPLVLDHYNEYVRLIERLRALTGERDRIYVAAWSPSVSPRSLEQVDRVSRPAGTERLGFWRSVPAVDSRDTYPLRKLLQSEYVVVPSPPQYFLAPERQRLLRLVHDLFVHNSEIAGDFVALPDRFDLGSPPAWQAGPPERRADTNAPGGVIARIYRRIRPTSLPVAIRTLATMEAAVAARPGGEHDWITLDATGASEVRPYGGARYGLVHWVRPGTSTVRTSFVYIERVADPVTVTGRIRIADGGATPHVALQATCMDRGGVLVSGPALKTTKVAAAGENFALPLRGCAGAFLILDWRVTHRRPVAAPYRLQVDQLELRSSVAPSPRL